MKYFSFILFLLSVSIYAQNDSIPHAWSLSDCINYTKENNIDLQRSRLNAESSAVDLLLQKGQWWPSLSFSAGYNLSNQPYNDPHNSSGGNASLDAGWTIYNGTRKKDITSAQYSEEQSRLNVEQSENSITEDIMQMYVQVLYSAEAVKVQEATLQTAKELEVLAHERYSLGSISKSDYTQIKAQVATDNYQLVNTEASLHEYLLRLKLLLNLDTQGEMQVVYPEYTDQQVLEQLPSPEETLALALQNRPEIQSSKIQMQSSELDINIARAGYYPSLRLSANTGTSAYTHRYSSFGEQLKDNWTNGAGITLSVPIISNRSTKSAVEKARINLESAKLQHSNEELNLRQTISLLWLNANSAQQNYIAARAQMQAAEESCQVVEEQFQQGLKSATDLLTERTNLLSAKQAFVQAKYMAIYNINMLKFYSYTLEL